MREDAATIKDPEVIDQIEEAVEEAAHELLHHDKHHETLTQQSQDEDGTEVLETKSASGSLHSHTPPPPSHNGYAREELETSRPSTPLTARGDTDRTEEAGSSHDVAMSPLGMAATDSSLNLNSPRYFKAEGGEIPSVTQVSSI
jgi:hypothetical protein